ncbi:MAG: type I-E CRISPR-associated protein Cse1/CasA [Thermodesulfobacteriota bacterium]
MPYNLMAEPWLPLRRRGGGVEWVEPWRLTDRGSGGDNPFVAVDAPRPDFSGALTEFLIGLVQTAWPPPDENAWHQAWQKPPEPETLRRAFAQVAHAFDLDGPGPRFMQQTLPAKAERWAAHLLLIEQPEDKKEKENKDHFIKRGQVQALCRPCLAAALHTLQTYAPVGGRGYQTSLRGGGPLTTLALGRDLWQTVWLAVQPAGRFWAKKPRAPEPGRIFPWLGPSPQGDRETRVTPAQADPAQAFWGMPRRVWVDFAAGVETGACSLCGRGPEPLVTGYFLRPNGIKYEGPWLHPLSPHSWKDGAPYAVKGHSGGQSYRHWFGLAVASGQDDKRKADGADKKIVARAQSIALFDERRRGLAGLDDGPASRRLWAFGYDVEDKKARAWVDSRMPLVTVEPDQRSDYEAGVRALVYTAEQAARTLATSLKQAWFGDGASVKSNQDDQERLGQLFWSQSEADFYTAVNRLKALLEAGHNFYGGEDADDARMNAFKEDWLQSLQDHALAIFDEYSQYDQVERANPKRIILARKNLRFRVEPRAKKMRQVLDLPELEKPAKQTKRGKGDKA